MKSLQPLFTLICWCFCSFFSQAQNYQVSFLITANYSLKTISWMPKKKVIPCGYVWQLIHLTHSCLSLLCSCSGRTSGPPTKTIFYSNQTPACEDLLNLHAGEYKSWIYHSAVLSIYRSHYQKKKTILWKGSQVDFVVLLCYNETNLIRQNKGITLSMWRHIRGVSVHRAWS